MDLIKLLDSYLVASGDKIVSSHHFYVFLSFKLGQVVDDIFATKCLPDRQVVHHEALGDHVKDSLSNIKHLLFTDLNLRLLLAIVSVICIEILLIVLLFFIDVLLPSHLWFRSRGCCCIVVTSFVFLVK